MIMSKAVLFKCPEARLVKLGIYKGKKCEDLSKQSVEVKRQGAEKCGVFRRAAWLEYLKKIEG